ncbi:helix-turn-helix transcriptional regulator [Neobacillus niacini]|uniref:helix-turn-helix transcriptional regulator n=1 Tax=Neobacillus niacini TaxID=86668 RepID=UPI0005EF2857|nr:AraC family transcriptional regulator [Neobacillus niacini]
MLSGEQVPSFHQIGAAHAGTVIYPPGGCCGPRIQPDLQLVLLHTGEMKVAVDGKSYAIKAGHAILLAPGHHEMFVFAEKQETWHRWISVHCGEWPSSASGDLKELPYIMPIPEEINRITDLMLILQAEHAAESEVMRSLGYAALQLCKSKLSLSKQQELHQSVKLAKQVIHQNYAQDLNLQQIADSSGVSPEHLVRLYRMHENTTPIKYVWHYRVLKAVELLSHTGLTIAEIAERCGFKTTFHFARLVKRQTGCTPSEIRRTCWTGE